MEILTQSPLCNASTVATTSFDVLARCCNLKNNILREGFKTSKTASTLTLDRNKILKEWYLSRKDNTIYTFSIKLSASSIGQEKS